MFAFVHFLADQDSGHMTQNRVVSKVLMVFQGHEGELHSRVSGSRLSCCWAAGSDLKLQLHRELNVL